MADIARIQEILQISPTTDQSIRAVLLEFLDLPQANKCDLRSSTAERVFPPVFGEDASIQIDHNFTKRNVTTWSTNCQLTPSIIITPRTPNDVGKALALCQFLDVKFSVRSGGHLHNPGFTSNEGGVVISMKNFTDLTVSDDLSTVDIGVGLTWLEVYEALDPYGLTVTGGRVPSVGVAGLLLGGGLSFQNSEHGLSCNGVVEYEVVLADSTIVKANAADNRDLFWALKGGGPNFGIVTKVKMSTVSPKVWAEGRIYSSLENNKLINAIMRYHKTSEKDAKATLIWQSAHEATLVVFFYCGHMESMPTVFEPFNDIPFLTQIVEPGSRTVYEVVNGFASVNAGERKSHDMRTMSSLPDLDVYNAAEECRLQQLEAIRHISGACITMVIQPISSSCMEACDANGGNPLGLEAKGHQWFLLMTDWSNPEDEATMLEASRKIVDRAEAVAKRNGTFLNFKYSNYSSRDQDPIASYGPENLEKLRSVAQAFDPRGVFQRLQYDGWLVSKAAI